MLRDISQKRLSSLTHAVDLELTDFLRQPFKASYVLSHTISFSDFYQPHDMRKIQDYLFDGVDDLYQEIEHVDVIAFGSEVGDFVGYRKEVNNGKTLMLQDARTNQELVIYRGQDVSADERSRYQEYDPRTRPWYEPVAKSRDSAWSDIYTNVDEQKAVTLSALSPVYSEKKFAGVIVVDIKIDTFNAFLASQQEQTDALIYVFDGDLRLVAQSVSDSLYSNNERALLASSTNPIIRASAKPLLALLNRSDESSQSFDIAQDEHRYFYQITPFIDPQGIHWYIGVAISEQDLLGPLQSTQNDTLLLALIAGCIGLIFGFVLLNQIVQPMVWTADAANTLAKGDWNSTIPKRGLIRETNVLLHSFQDMSSNLRASFRALREQILMDSLTRLASRTGLVEKADELAPLYGCLLVIGIDKFRDVNDSLGHYHGDQILKVASARLKSQFQHDRHTLARIGGDEFAVYLHQPQMYEQSLLAANRILQSFASPISIDSEATLIHVSVGVVTLNENEEMSLWLQKGSIALSHAKKHPTKICHYETDMDLISRHKTTIVPKIKTALDNQEFVPYYQPLVSLKTGKVIGAEALARWVSPERGLVSPLEFIPVAEEYGLINEIGFGILEQACRDMIRGLEEGKFSSDFHMHVNLSVQQLAQPGCISAIMEILDKTEIDPKQLTLEITESKLVDNDSVTNKNMRAIRRLGIGIAIDDFGTGYSSLAYLHTLPFNCLKIDRIFVEQMTLDDDKPSLVQTIIDLTSNLKRELVAEGIETQAQADMLAKLNCPIGQGYLFSRPVPYEEWDGEAFERYTK